MTEVTKYIEELAARSIKNNGIVPEMYTQHDVKRGLRDINGNGVIAGLTEISVINWKKKNENGEWELCDGELYYRGIDINDIVNGFMSEDRAGFEETVYLLLFSELPTKVEERRLISSSICLSFSLVRAYSSSLRLRSAAIPCMEARE